MMQMSLNCVLCFVKQKDFFGIYSLVGEKPTATVHISNLQKNNTTEF